MGLDKKANVLLVDDKTENLLALETVLGDLGQNLIRATSAREALRFLLLEDVALILLDVQMPGLSGFELAELIRERERTQHTPIIFISAESIQEQNIFKGYSLGAVDYLTKPVEPEILKSKVRFFSKLYLQQAEIRSQARQLADANAQLDGINVELEERVHQRTEELERANLELELEVKERRESEARLATEHAITRALALADSVEIAVKEILRAFIQNMNAAVAALWQVSSDGRQMVCSDIEFDSSQFTRISSFITDTKRRELTIGEGLPGQVWSDRTTVWLPNTVTQPNFPRARVAASAGLHSGIGFPIKIGNGIWGVIEFFTAGPLHADQKVLDMLDVVGSEIGQFIQKKRFEEEREILLAREKMLREEAEKANRLKDEFLATLSHELRTPLNSILGWSQIVLGDMVDSDGIRTALETIHRNATSQAQLIEELLEASRLITGKLTLNLGPTEIAPAIQAAIDTILPKAGAKNIEIVTDFHADVTTMTSDSSRLQQMVWNLLSNSVKFTPDGGRIEVRTDHVGDKIEISVSDTGAGISPDFLPYVFDRFRQEDSTSTRKHDGLGLGLAIVRHLAELHGGKVSAHSEGLERGSTFTIILPLSQTESIVREEEKEAEVRPYIDSSFDRLLEGVRIHVVDDDEDSCNLLKFAFGLRGAEVRTSSTAAEAYKSIEKDPPDILLADINMPDEDGYSLIRKVRDINSQNGIQFPAIALTAMARAEDSEKALAAGFHMHIPKPVEIDELVATIADLLRHDRSSNGKGAARTTGNGGS
jgi:signal transduction histidine kinase/DNA-binding response OmpR family regulator